MVGDRALNELMAGTTDRLKGTLAPAYVPVIFAVTEDVTGVLWAVNVAMVEPAGTVTVAGTVIAALLLDRPIAIPPVGAGPLRIAVTPTGSPAIVGLKAGT